MCQIAFQLTVEVLQLWKYSSRNIIYSFCKMYALDKKVDQLLPLSAKNGLMNIVYDSGTFIRNQNIKGCDYD